MAATSIGLSIFLSLGLVACYDPRQVGPQQSQQAVSASSDGLDGPPPPDSGPAGECVPGEVWCQDLQTVVLCNDDGVSSTAKECGDYCLETTGYQPYSFECNAEAEDPCQCDYDIVSGCGVAVRPSDFPAAGMLALLVLALRRRRR